MYCGVQTANNLINQQCESTEGNENKTHMKLKLPEYRKYGYK